MDLSTTSTNCRRNSSERTRADRPLRRGKPSTELDLLDRSRGNCGYRSTMARAVVAEQTERADISEVALEILAFSGRADPWPNEEETDREAHGVATSGTQRPIPPSSSSSHAGEDFNFGVRSSRRCGRTACACSPPARFGSGTARPNPVRPAPVGKPGKSPVLAASRASGSAASVSGRREDYYRVLNLAPANGSPGGG